VATKEKTPLIKYTNRDFESIKSDLVNYAKVYYPDTYSDFNEASFGAMMIDMIAYVGDIMSFYVDYQANESFLDSATETQNIIRLAKQMGFKYPGSPSSTGICAFYAVVPAATAGGQPNEDYIPVLKKGSTLSSDAGAIFILNENIDFSTSDVQRVVAEENTSGQALSYAFRAYGEVVSGEFDTEFLEIGSYQRFMRLKLSGENITEVISVIDSKGHEYFEVDYLSQNLIFKAIRNRKDDSEQAPYILQEQVVARRFTVEHTSDGKTLLQFGYGSEETLKEGKFPDPSTAVLQQHGKDYYSDNSFDPNVLMQTEKFGVVPPAGTMTVVVRKNTTANVNVPANSINAVVNPILGFKKVIAAGTRATIRDSLSADNEEPITGQVRALTSLEIKTRAIDTFASQNRAVTRQDYLSLIYRMPAKFGAVKRANIIQDKVSFKRNLNLYIVSEDTDGKLSPASQSLKENLKTYINNFKMINDTIDILDGRIANFAIEFELVGVLDVNPTELLAKAIQTLKDEYEDQLFFGTPFYISEIYKILNDIPEVIDTKTVRIVTRRGSRYNTTDFDVEDNTTSDGRYIMVPPRVVLELKYPDLDIVGVVT